MLETICYVGISVGENRILDYDSEETGEQNSKFIPRRHHKEKPCLAGVSATDLIKGQTATEAAPVILIYALMCSHICSNIQAGHELKPRECNVPSNSHFPKTDQVLHTVCKTDIYDGLIRTKHVQPHISSEREGLKI